MSQKNFRSDYSSIVFTVPIFKEGIKFQRFKKGKMRITYDEGKQNERAFSRGKRGTP